MRLIILLLYLLVSSLQLASAVSLHAHLRSLKGLPETRADNASGTVSHVSDDLVHSPHGAARSNDIAQDTSHKDDHSSLTSRFLTSSLDRWGSPIWGREQHKLEHQLHAQSSQRRSSLGRLILFLLAAGILITCLSCVCACFGRWWDEEETKGPDPTLAAVEYCNGPWAVAYRESNGQQREAIELLFRCNIITMPEFAGHGVSRQHSDINACVQIAIGMLEDRSISEWEAHWQEAHKAFEQAASSPRSSPREFSFCEENRERYRRA